LRGDEAVLRELERLAVRPSGDIDVDELTHPLYALREFDRTRPIAESRHQALRAYRLSQAIWAAEADLGTEDAPARPDVDPSISFLLLPPATDETSR